MSEKEFTMDQVREHNKQDDCWMVIGNDKTGTYQDHFYVMRFPLDKFGDGSRVW